MTNPTPTLAAIPLWTHQRKALECIVNYLKAPKTATTGSALIHMPTGTGKSGVIACASHFIETVETVLVLTPRLSLREQLAEELSGKFFEKLNFSRELPKTVVNIQTSSALLGLSDLKNTILVCTIQMLQSLLDEPFYKVLQSQTGLILVDEGHYEPAVSWSDAIRGVGAPRVLFTATPFRNDLKLFDVDFDHAFSYSFDRAIKDNVIRAVKIEDRPTQSDAVDFVADVIDFYDTTFPSSIGREPPRVIIRCDSMATIRQIGASLQAKGKSVILIHENFKDNDSALPHERKTVPSPDDEGAIFWVHQFKLLEGIDDPRFQLIALYEELRSTRGLIQQIGRVVRNPSRKPGQFAYFLDHSSGRQKELWTDFLKFDKLVEKEGIRIADFGTNILRSMQSAQPEIVYLEGRFRISLDLDDFLPYEELLLPQTMNVLKQSSSMDFTKLTQNVKADFERDDRYVRYFGIDANTAIFAYLDFKNSPLLRSKSFIECKLGVTILRQTLSYMCVFDSFGAIPLSISKCCDSVPVQDLRKLFANTSGTHLTTISLHNSHLGQRAIRTRSISASKIDDTLPTFDDHAFICRTAKGRSSTNGISTRRYVGFGTGKVTDSSINRVDLETYIKWLDGITRILDSSATPIASFSRFATVVDPPSDPTPKHLLLDLQEVENAFHCRRDHATSAGEQLQLQDSCCDVTAGNFSIIANGRTYSGTISFVSKNMKYEISIPKLDTDFTTIEPDLKHGLVSFLNRNQSFRVITESAGIFYTLGEFYSPVLQFGTKYKDDQIGLKKVLSSFDCLGKIGSEKGSHCASDGSAWDKDSLFSIIDTLGVGHKMKSQFGSPDIVVCDDLGTEAADFILVYKSEKRVVFIHCKGKSTGRASKYSASNLQEVCAQATKNLRYFSRFDDVVPPNAHKWHKWAWSGAKDVTGKVNDRIRKSPTPTSGNKLWTEIRSIIRDPYSELEVWLLLGRLLSKTEFEKQLTNARPAAEAQQAAYLLFSTMNDVAAVGGRLKVLCSP